MINFDFSNNQVVSPEDVAKAEAILDGKVGNFLEPGHHTVTIQTVERTGMSDKDPTWAKVKLTLASGDKITNTTLMVPTTKETFDGSGKNSSFMFTKLQRFFKAIGIDLISGSPGPTLKQYFGNADALIGKQLEIDIGYQRDFIGYSEGQYFLCKRDGSRLSTKTHEARNLAEAEALELGIEVDKFPNVTRFYPALNPASDEPAGW